ncbi:hypothetical protein HPB48_007481 [Haemaphysalis longicornis]|uniref:Uncharacterized protein n=1 Tax=Haemaphysalis longicornis TaxID=44386 RepID=A0A9J6GEE7_HAELO|nr:hypothetical protein HPB48_007481 [Haemaphysalis longicornis]
MGQKLTQGVPVRVPLLGGSVVCLLGVYVSTMVDRCPALSGQPHSNSAHDPEAALRRGRVMTSCSSVSIYLRIGVIAVHRPVNLAMPVLHALFTFLQMHFVFMNAQGVARSLGCLRHLVLVHLVVTNVAVWLKLLLWETASEWLRQSHVLQDGESTWPPKDFNFTTHVIDEQGEHKAYCTSPPFPSPARVLPPGRFFFIHFLEAANR